MSLPSERSDVVLRLLDGHGAERVVLPAGRASSPLTLGREGGWRIDARKVADAHVMLAYNGSVLYACACPGQSAALGGIALGPTWVEVPVPVELRFGGARVGIGRHARHDAETEMLVGDDEATCIDDGSIAFPAQAGPSHEEATCYDEERLREALRHAVPDAEATCVGDVNIPPAARRPDPGNATQVMAAMPALETLAPVVAAPPPVTSFDRRAPTLLMPPLRVAPPPPNTPPMNAAVASFRAPLAGLSSRIASMPASARTLASPLLELGDDRPSCMPPTMPSDGLAEAVPAPSRTGLPVALAFAGERGHAEAPFGVGELTTARRGGTGRSPAVAPGAPSFVDQARAQVRALSGPKKAIGLLLVPLLVLGVIGALPTRGAPRAPVVRAAPAVVTPATTSSPGGEASSRAVASTPGQRASAAPPGPALPPAPVGLAPVGPAPDRTARAATAAGLRDTRTAERHALDTTATGDLVAAGAEYDALAAAHPDNLAFREAARIVRERRARRVD